jgi:hypothetical protein
MRFSTAATVLVICASTVMGAIGQSATPLPFAVSIGGIPASAEAGKPFATISKPVAQDAEISLGVTPDMAIINVSKTGADGTPLPGAQPAIILLQKSPTGSLAKTMDQQKLAPGNYLMSITANSATALVQFSIK